MRCDVHVSYCNFYPSYPKRRESAAARASPRDTTFLFNDSIINDRARARAGRGRVSRYDFRMRGDGESAAVSVGVGELIEQR